MKIFLDCEFTGLHQNTTLISIGLIAENERAFYAEFTDYDQNQLDNWLRENIINNLWLPDNTTGTLADGVTIQVRGDTPLVRDYLTAWIFSLGSGPHEIWFDCLAYDWVLFCQLWGHAFNVPETIYYIPFDIATLFKAWGLDPDTNREEFAGLDNSSYKHNALWDAQVIKACYERLIGNDSV